jgi:hypothetical protein
MYAQEPFSYRIYTTSSPAIRQEFKVDRPAFFRG